MHDVCVVQDHPADLDYEIILTDRWVWYIHKPTHVLLGCFLGGD